LRSSVCILESFLLKSTSPTIPSAINASKMADPHPSRNELYGGCIAAIKNSATTAKTTNPPHPHAQRSQDEEAISKWLSVAFIVPRGKRHARNEFRGFWVGFGIGALIFGLVLAAHWLL
jgi:hypothetical protein